jgi:4-hydroxyacetophenone monooxygenase
MIGAGATGFQVAPAIAEQVRSLTIIQRTAQWMFPNPGYHDAVGPGVPWAIEHLPFYGRWFRFLIYWPSCDAGLVAAKVDPAWDDQEHSVSEVNDLTRVMFTEWITSQVDDDPELVAKVVPTYPPTGKRTLQDNGSWLRTLTRDDVELVRAGVDHLEADAVVDSNGDRHRADVVIWATGFRPAVAHLAPLHLRSPLGGIALDGTTSVADPRIQLVGYGPSASTIGANRAGRTAARGVADRVRRHAVDGVGAAG